MQNDMRDRLVGLIKQIDFDFTEECSVCIEDGYKGLPMLEDFFADHLIANGVVLPPYKIGSMVWVIASQTSDNKNLYIFIDYITHYRIVDDCTIMCLENHLGVPNWDWDKVFLTKDQAEQKLKEMRVENG